MSRLPRLSRTVLWFALMLASLWAAACTPVVGDKCTYDRQCGTTLTCDTTYPDGYCLKAGCRAGECPPEATCVDFGMDIRYCMRTCAPDDECRSDLACRPSQCTQGQEPNASQPCSLDGKSFCGLTP